MPNQPLNHGNTALTEESMLLDARIVRALERAPAVSIPADFSARVAGRAPARDFARVKATHYGRNAAVLCFFLLIVAFLVLPPRATGSAVHLCLQWTLCLQIALLTAWMVSKGTRQVFFPSRTFKQVAGK